MLCCGGMLLSSQHYVKCTACLYEAVGGILQWFERAGFVDIKIKRIGPSWYRGVRRHGLIIGCSVTGVKPKVCAAHVIGSAAVLTAARDSCHFVCCKFLANVNIHFRHGCHWYCN